MAFAGPELRLGLASKPRRRADRREDRMAHRMTTAGRAALGLALLGLTACGAGDTQLSTADVARRAGITRFSETFTQQIHVGQDAAYYDLHCLDGSRIAAGGARIVAVSGNEASARDYTLVARLYPETNKVLALVRTTRAGFAAAPPAVTVELRVSCYTEPAG
jgi:hypothetical protein